MFATDGISIYYPTSPDRMFWIRLADLAAWDGSDEHAEHMSSVGDLQDMVETTIGPDAAECSRLLAVQVPAPAHAPLRFEGGLDCMEALRQSSQAEDAEDFADALAMWADWCDERSAALDADDGVPAAKQAA